MTIEIKTPTFPESVADGTVATWYKKPGEAISRDDLIVDIETDKVVLEVVASADGVLKEILKLKKLEIGGMISNFRLGDMSIKDHKNSIEFFSKEILPHL